MPRHMHGLVLIMWGKKQNKLGWDKIRWKYLKEPKIKLALWLLRAASTLCFDESVSSALEWILFTEHWRKTEERLGGLICCVTAPMPSGWWFEEDTWDQRTWTMSRGVTLNWDELLFIPRALLLFLFSHQTPLPLSLIPSLFTVLKLMPPSYSPSGGM